MTVGGVGLGTGMLDGLRVVCWMRRCLDVAFWLGVEVMMVMMMMVVVVVFC